MVFSSLLFLFLFLPLNLLAYFFARDIRTKNTVMLVFSLIFYAWGEPLYILLLVGMTLADWYFTLLLSKEEPRSKRAKLWLAAAVATNLVLLGIFKYGSFIMTAINFFLIALVLFLLIKAMMGFKKAALRKTEAVV